MGDILYLILFIFSQATEGGVIEATYTGRIEEPRPRFIYQFYHLQNRPPPESVSIKGLKGIIQSFNKALSESERFPFLRELIMGEILFLYNLGENYDTTKAIGRAYLNSNPRPPGEGRGEVLYNLAESYYYTKDYSSAEELFKKIKEDFPNAGVTPFAKVSLGWIYLHQSRWSEAYKEFRSIIDDNPNPTSVVLAIYGTGIVFYNVAYYDSALPFFSFDESAYKNKNIFCALAKDLLDDNLYHAGWCYYRLRYYGDAIDAWKRLTMDYLHSPYTPDAAFCIGDLYFRAEKYNDAITYLELGAKRNPNSPSAKTALLEAAQSYYNLKEDEKAQKIYEELLRKYPEDSSEILTGMENSLHRQAKETDDPEVLERVLKKFKEYIPNNEYLPELSFKLGEKWLEKYEYKKAMEVFRQTVFDYPDSPQAPQAQLKLAECFIKMKDWEATARAYQDFIRNFPTNENVPFATFYLGVAYATLAKYHPKRSRDYYRKAINTFEEVIKKFPTTPWAEKAKVQKKACEQMLK